MTRKHGKLPRKNAAKPPPRHAKLRKPQFVMPKSRRSASAKKPAEMQQKRAKPLLPKQKKCAVPPKNR